MPLSVMRGQRRPSARWSERDRLLALALHLFEEDKCSGCGQPMTESMDPSNEGRYVAPPPHRCHACTAIEQRQDAYAEANQPGALRFTVDLVKRVTGR